MQNIIDFKCSSKILISERVENQLKYLRRKINKTEWSGILVWKELSGSIRNIDSLTISLEYIFLKDIGSTVFTEYYNSVDTLNLYKVFPEAINMRLGHIHSHHNMSTGFSGTDRSEVIECAKSNVAFLSIIVNNFGEMTAKISVEASLKKPILLLKDLNDSQTQIKLEDAKTNYVVIFHVENDNSNEVEIPELNDRISIIEKAKTEKNRFKYPQQEFEWKQNSSGNWERLPKVESPMLARQLTLPLTIPETKKEKESNVVSVQIDDAALMLGLAKTFGLNSTEELIKLFNADYDKLIEYIDRNGGEEIISDTITEGIDKLVGEELIGEDIQNLVYRRMLEIVNKQVKEENLVLIQSLLF